jgi:hypothetical protein
MSNYWNEKIEYILSGIQRIINDSINWLKIDIDKIKYSNTNIHTTPTLYFSFGNDEGSLFEEDGSINVQSPYYFQYSSIRPALTKEDDWAWWERKFNNLQELYHFFEKYPNVPIKFYLSKELQSSYSFHGILHFLNIQDFKSYLLDKDEIV